MSAKVKIQLSPRDAISYASGLIALGIVIGFLLCGVIR